MSINQLLRNLTLILADVLAHVAGSSGADYLPHDKNLKITVEALRSRLRTQGAGHTAFYDSKVCLLFNFQSTTFYILS